VKDGEVASVVGASNLLRMLNAWMGPSGLSTGMSEANEVRCSGSTKRELAHEVGPS